MPQQTFWCYDDQRFAPVTDGLAAEAMKQLRRGRGINDLDIVLDAEQKEAFEARAGMLRALAFKAVVTNMLQRNLLFTILLLNSGFKRTNNPTTNEY